MRSLTTYLTDQDIQQIVSQSGQIIRTFLRFLLNPEVKSFLGVDRSQVDSFLVQDEELNDILEDYKKNPAEYTDQELVNKGADVHNSHKMPVRIEVRKTPGMDGASQIAVRGLFGKFRNKALENFMQLPSFISGALVVKTSGQKSFEFNARGVTKALPIKYIKARFEYLLKEMKYTPEQDFLNVLKEKFIFAADGDGTLYDKPSTTGLPEFFDSPAFVSMILYLQLGGVFVLISGNSLDRVDKRVSEFIPRQLHNRILIAANGGADLAFIGQSGKLETIEHYQNEALNLDNHISNDVCVMYAGDDSSEDGNDFEAFNEVGFQQSICVGEPKGAGNKLDNICVGGFERSTAKCFKFLSDRITNNIKLDAMAIQNCFFYLKG